MGSTRILQLKRFFGAILASRKMGLLRLRPADQPMRLVCLGGDCGLCCREMAGGVVVAAEEKSQLPVEAIEEFATTSVLKSGCDGCVLLENNYCSQYQNRPKSCRDYPWYNINGQLFFDKGCPGIKFDQDERPNVKTIVSINQYLPMAAVWQRMLCSVFRIW